MGGFLCSWRRSRCCSARRARWLSCPADRPSTSTRRTFRSRRRPHRRRRPEQQRRRWRHRRIQQWRHSTTPGAGRRDRHLEWRRLRERRGRRPNRAGPAAARPATGSAPARAVTAPGPTPRRSRARGVRTPPRRSPASQLLRRRCHAMTTTRPASSCRSPSPSCFSRSRQSRGIAAAIQRSWSSGRSASGASESFEYLTGSHNQSGCVEQQDPMRGKGVRMSRLRVVVLALVACFAVGSVAVAVAKPGDDKKPKIKKIKTKVNANYQAGQAPSTYNPYQPYNPYDPDGTNATFTGKVKAKKDCDRRRKVTISRSRPDEHVEGRAVQLHVPGQLGDAGQLQGPRQGQALQPRQRREQEEVQVQADGKDASRSWRPGRAKRSPEPRRRV